MPHRWDQYALYVDDRLVTTTTDWDLARGLYRTASRGVSQRYATVRLLGIRGHATRLLVRKPR
jgi:hypothetical protein